MNNEKVQRNSSIELLRIIAILLVFMFHFMMHANSDTVVGGEFTINQLIAFILGSWGTVANCIFFSISAYFLIEKKSIEIHKCIALFLKVSVIGTILYLVYRLKIVGGIEFSAVFKTMFGIFTYQYWFLSAYFVLMFIYPMLNEFIHRSSKKYFQMILCMLFLFTTLLPGRSELMGRICVAVVTYLLIGYCERFLSDLNMRRIGGLVTLLIFVGVVTFETTCSYYGRTNLTGSFLACNSPTSIIGGISIFYFFKSFNIKNNKILNFGGRHAIGAYLLNFPIVISRNEVWDGLLHADIIFSKKPVLFMLLYGCVALGFSTLGILIDYFYDITIDRSLKKFMPVIEIKMKNTEEDI